MCFEDVKTSMFYSVKEVKMAVRAKNINECNKAKDFVPLGRTDTITKRSTKNARSRKATLV